MDHAQTSLSTGTFNLAASRYYDPDVARTFFESGGRFEEFAAGAKVFSEGDTGDMRLPVVKVKRRNQRREGELFS